MRPTSISTVFDYVQTNAESGARNDALNTYLATTDRAIEMGSGERAKYRHSMVVASHQPGSSARASLGFPIAFHILSNFGWIYFAPVATTLMLTRAPAATRGTMAGISMLSVTAGSLISGRLGALYEKVSASDFWLIHAAIVGGAGLAFFAICQTACQAFAGKRRCQSRNRAAACNVPWRLSLGRLLPVRFQAELWES